MSKSKIDTISKQELTYILQNSSSFEEVCAEIGYKQISSTLKERIYAICKKYNLDTAILDVSKVVNTKICTECGKEKNIEEFYSRRNVCKECVRKKERDKYSNRMSILNNYKKGLKCAKCGENRYYLLDFHHNDPNEKDYSISDNPNAKMETILEEIKKCTPLCSNCHRQFHFFNRENGILLDEYLSG